MAAHKGNKYNEVWDIETAEQFCDDVLQYILDNKKCRSLSEACTELGEYEELLSYLHNKFNKDFKPIKKAKDIVKTRLANQALDGIANPTMAIFLLKNNHNMTDRQQTDITTNGKDVNTAPIIKFVDTDEDGD
jgi:transposase-like protein